MVLDRPSPTLPRWSDLPLDQRQRLAVVIGQLAIRCLSQAMEAAHEQPAGGSAPEQD